MNSVKHNPNPLSEGKGVLLFCLLFGSVNDKSTALNENFGTLNYEYIICVLIYVTYLNKNYR